MVAIWRAESGLVGVPGPISPQASDSTWSPAEEATPKSGRSNSGWRGWIPTLERTPPLVQFIVRLGRWVKAKCHSGDTQAPHLRLVGQLTLGGKRHLSLVEVGGAQFLIGGGVEHVTVIVPVAAPDPFPTEKRDHAERPQPL